jgi:hypothetical protein
MSSSRTNGLTKDYSGKFGDQYVLRRKNGKSLMTKLPEKRTGEPTEGQKAVTNRFLAGAEFAKRILRNPEIRAEYAARSKGKMSPHTMAMADFLNPPAVIAIGVTEYRGNAGDTIRVLAVDNFKVVRVTANIMAGDATILEFGDCIQQEDGAAWIYTVTGEHLPLAGQQVKAVAYDIPGNPGEAICSV